MDLYILTIIFLIIVIIVSIIYYNKSIESFDNLTSNLYTYDTCCSQNQISNCQKYGKTGVCDYNLDNNSCICQNAY